jgi:hypothetical protein
LATKLGSAEQTTDFDSGILARMIEMGVPGTLLLLAALVASLGALLSGWSAVFTHDAILQDRAAAMIAMLIALAGNELAGDISGLLALLFWLSLSLAPLSQTALRSALPEALAP